MKRIVEDIPGLSDLLARAGEISGRREENPRAVPLFGDGSDRKFFRIFCGTTSYVGLISPRKNTNSVDENDSYLLIGGHLHRKKVPVPRILYADACSGRFLLEDAGDLHLQKYACSRPACLQQIYGHAAKMLAALHRKAPEGFASDFCFDGSVYDPPFVYKRELEYFRNSFLNIYMGLEIAADELRSDFERLAEAAGVGERRFVFHRDFQSRNIMVHRNRLWLIDFQGMRFGPPEYDLASLLADPYVRIPKELQERVAGYYWTSAGKSLGCNRGEFLKRYLAVRLCRNLQILGAFGFLGIVKGKRHFLRYIPAAWRQLLQHLRDDCRGQFPQLQKVASAVNKVGFPRQADEKLMTSALLSVIWLSL
ncbi:MAG: aminoglycoside phosphotransferase family protein [Syntrophobacteraceae bacterium]